MKTLIFFNFLKCLQVEHTPSPPTDDNRSLVVLTLTETPD